MTNLKKATPETAMSEIPDRFMAKGSLSQQETAELLFNAFRLIRRLENAVLEQVKEKREIDAERLARVAEMKENETHNMRLVRQARDRQQAERERIVAADGFMDALDAELLKDEEPAVNASAKVELNAALANAEGASRFAAAHPEVAKYVQDKNLAELDAAERKAVALKTATSAAAVALRAQMLEHPQRARPAAPAPSAPAPLAVKPKPRGHFTGGMTGNGYGA